MAAATLTACMGSGGGGSGSEDAVALITAPNLPDTGTATYSDNVNIQLSESGGPLTLNGDLDINVNFADPDNVSGSLTDITDSDAGNFGTSSFVIDGFIEESAQADDFALRAELSGTITRQGDGVTYSPAMDSATIAGDFYGTSDAAIPEQIRGQFQGTLQRTEGGVTETAVIEEDRSTFTATR